MTREETAICKQIKEIASRLGLTVESYRSSFYVFVTQYECIDKDHDTMANCLITVESKKMKDGSRKTVLQYYPRLEHIGEYDEDTDEEIILPTDPYILCIETEPWEIVHDHADPDSAFLQIDETSVDINAVSPGKLESALTEFLETMNRVDSEWSAQRIAAAGKTLAEKLEKSKDIDR